MKTSDFICDFPPRNRPSRTGICRVRVFFTPAGEEIALLTDLGRLSTSSSVTDSVENIRATIIKRGFATERVQIIEHYESLEVTNATFDLVAFDEEGQPSWKSLDPAEVALIFGRDLPDIEERTISDRRIGDEIARFRNAIDPFVDSVEPEEVAVTIRRVEIQEKMISKRELVELVNSNAIEQDLQKLLKRDLSIFAEIYARPFDDYICFSEFPVGDGFVDFVVFSGVSRMEITFIEVKGADFNLTTQGSYEKFSSKIETAADQIRRRLFHALSNMREFQIAVHKTRKEVEKGKLLYNSLTGPSGKLMVDPGKNLIVRGVVVGGRTNDDLEESEKRHQYELMMAPPVSVESWDTFIRKIQRN